MRPPTAATPVRPAYMIFRCPPVPDAGLWKRGSSRDCRTSLAFHRHRRLPADGQALESSRPITAWAPRARAGRTPDINALFMTLQGKAPIP